jgi:hypothetical protein
MNQLRFIRQVIYKLKRRYGQPIHLLYRTSTATVDLATGVKSVPHDVVRIRRAVCLPLMLDRTFYYDLTFIATNKNFTYGGHTDRAQQSFIIDTRDLPKDFKITVGMWIVHDKQRFDIQTAEMSEAKAAYLIVARQIVSSDASDILDERVSDTIDVEETVEDA